ncbi:response regulator [bacterium]|nr:response regulator [bacterium]NUN45883.1 response regulator [bacterium]
MSGTLKRILIVDDEETLTFSLYQSFIISKENYEVVTASSGTEAWEKFAEHPFDLILTDITMPGISGIELLKRVKKERPQTHVIIMTAYGSDEKKEEALSFGAYRYIEKPFEIKMMKSVIAEALK